jgi:hypothetical protein
VAVAVREAVGAGTAVTKTVSMDLYAELCMLLFVCASRSEMILLMSYKSWRGIVLNGATGMGRWPLLYFSSAKQ